MSAAFGMRLDFSDEPLMGAVKFANKKALRRAGAYVRKAARNKVFRNKKSSNTLESGEADVTTRAAAGWKASVATLKEASLEFGMLYDTADTDFLAFQTVYFSNTPLALFISDGHGGGLDADFSVTGFTIEQNLFFHRFAEYLELPFNGILSHRFGEENGKSVRSILTYIFQRFDNITQKEIIVF